MEKETHRKGKRYGVHSGSSIKKCSACSISHGDVRAEITNVFYASKFAKMEEEAKRRDVIDKSERKRLSKKQHAESDETETKSATITETRKANNKEIWKQEGNIDDVTKVIRYAKKVTRGDWAHKHVFYSWTSHKDKNRGWSPDKEDYDHKRYEKLAVEDALNNVP